MTDDDYLELVELHAARKRDADRNAGSRAELEKQLRDEFGLTPKQAEAEVAKLEREVKRLEGEADKEYDAVMAEFGPQLGESENGDPGRRPESR